LRRDRGIAAARVASSAPDAMVKISVLVVMVGPLSCAAGEYDPAAARQVAVGYLERDRKSKR